MDLWRSVTATGFKTNFNTMSNKSHTIDITAEGVSQSLAKFHQELLNQVNRCIDDRRYHCDQLTKLIRAAEENSTEVNQYELEYHEERLKNIVVTIELWYSVLDEALSYSAKGVKKNMDDKFVFFHKD